jgi:hypothetical protein
MRRRFSSRRVVHERVTWPNVWCAIGSLLACSSFWIASRGPFKKIGKNGGGLRGHVKERILKARGIATGEDLNSTAPLVVASRFCRDPGVFHQRAGRASVFSFAGKRDPN